MHLYTKTPGEGEGVKFCTNPQMETMMHAVSSLYRNIDGTWATFDAAHLGLVQLGIRTLDTGVQAQILTTNGFYANHFMKTDDRPDSSRNDGIVGTVAERNNGYGYGTNVYFYDGWSRSLWQYDYNSPFLYNVTNTIGGYFGNPIEAASSISEGFSQYHITKRSWPVADFTTIHPLTLISPVMNQYGTFVGAVEVRVEVARLLATALNSEMGERKTTGLKLFLVDTEDYTVLSTADRWGQLYHVVKDVLLPELQLTEYDLYTSLLLKTDEIKDHGVRSYFKYINETNGWIGQEGAFEQKEHWTYVNQHYMDLQVSGTGVTDVSGQGVGAELSCTTPGGCIVKDNVLRKDVMQFDGSTVLYAYRNLTVSNPRVAATRISTPDHPWVWDSSRQEYRETIKFSDGTECVSLRDYSSDGSYQKKCLLLPTIEDGRDSYTISIRIRPDVAYTESYPLASTPRLFSDTLQGEANVRIFGNGQFFVNIIRTGCSTKAIPGGPPVGKWTTLTFVMEYNIANGIRHCAAYLDGVLHDRQLLEETYHTQARYTPLYIGRFFKGRMDSVAVIAHELNEKEIRTLYETHKVVEEVEHKEWFYSTVLLDLNDRWVRDGIKWSLSTILPRAEIMEKIDQNNIKVRAKLRAQTEHTANQLQRDTEVAVLVLTVIALFSVIIFLVFNHLLTRPFANYATLMNDAAVMNIDELPAGESFISELRTMNKAMTLMLANLKEYKSYMPQTLQFGLTTDGELSDHASKMSHSGGKADTATIASGHEESKSWSGKRGNAFDRTTLTCALTKKRFALASLNICNWHERIDTCQEMNVITLHEQVVTEFMTIFTQCKGVPEVFSGDRFICSFNAAKLASNCKVAATTSCVLLRDNLKKTVAFDISGGVVAAEGRVGNMGNAMMKRYSFVTKSYAWAIALERFARSKCCSILVDHMVLEEATHTFKMKIVDMVLFKKYNSNSMKVSEVVSAKEMKGDEWMYEMEAAAKGDVYVQWNSWAVALMDGFIEVCAGKNIPPHCPPNTIKKSEESLISV